MPYIRLPLWTICNWILCEMYIEWIQMHTNNIRVLIETFNQLLLFGFLHHVGIYQFFDYTCLWFLIILWWIMPWLPCLSFFPSVSLSFSFLSFFLPSFLSFLSHSFLCVCACVYTHVQVCARTHAYDEAEHMYVCATTCTDVHARGQMRTPGILLYDFHFLPLRWGLLLYLEQG